MQEKKIKILSVDFNREDKRQLMEKISQGLRSGAVTTIFTPNPQMLIAAKRDATLSDLLNSASIKLPDGIGISIGAKILKENISERISGIDFAKEILELAQNENYSVFLLGAKPGRAELAKDQLLKNFPHLKICGCNDGYFQKQGEENERIISKINALKPDILFVCLGFPAQERWISENLPSLPSVKLAMGLGGSIDVWSGHVKRAPRAMQKIGLEWLWRMIREPRRIKILIDIPTFLFDVYMQKRALRGKAKRS